MDKALSIDLMLLNNLSKVYVFVSKFAYQIDLMIYVSKFCCFSGYISVFFLYPLALVFFHFHNEKFRFLFKRKTQDLFYMFVRLCP